MAVSLYSNAVNTFRGKNTSVPSRVLESYQARGRRYSAVESYVANIANAATGTTVAMVWVPYRARIIGGSVSINTNMGANSTIAVGVEGVSSGTSESNVSKLRDAAAATSAAKLDLFATTNTYAGAPYTVTDKEGAYVTVTFANNAGAAGKVTANVEWVEA